jgi:ribosome-binding protein aMBF1 (putative translation factor)
MYEDINKVSTSLGKRLRLLREALGLSQEELAFRSEIAPSCIYQTERAFLKWGVLFVIRHD